MTALLASCVVISAATNGTSYLTPIEARKVLMYSPQDEEQKSRLPCLRTGRLNTRFGPHQGSLQKAVRNLQRCLETKVERMVDMSAQYMRLTYTNIEKMSMSSGDLETGQTGSAARI